MEILTAYVRETSSYPPNHPKITLTISLCGLVY